MRSRTSRGVPKWSGGKDLYIGSPVSAIGTSFGVIGIVPGPSEGSRGPTGWGHLSRRVPWAEVGRDPAQSGLGRHFVGERCRKQKFSYGFTKIHLEGGGRRPRGVACLPRQVGRPPHPRVSNPRRRGEAHGGAQPTRGWFPSHFSPRGPPG